MDPIPRPRLHFFVLIFRSPKCGSHNGKDLGCTEDVEVFPSQYMELIPHHIGSIATDVIVQKDDSVRQHSRAFSLYGASQHHQPPKKESHLSALLCLPPFPMLDEHFYTMLTTRAIKKQLCGPVRFHCACLLPYR